MKKILVSLCINFMVQSSNAQVTLEHSYPNAYYFAGLSAGDYVDFGVTWLTSATSKYYLINYPNETLTLYNMNHSVFSTVTIPVTYTNSSVGYYISYITASLFDCDSTTVEYLLNYFDFNGNTFYVRVYRTNGTQLTNIPNGTLDNCIGCAGIIKGAITNTSSGTKMLVGITNGYENVYSLCGSLPTGFSAMSNTNVESAFLNAYPNPFSDYTIIDYELPQGERTGEVIFYDMNGREVKRFTVDNTFKDLRVSTADLAAGTYTCVLQSKNGNLANRRIIRIK